MANPEDKSVRLMLGYLCIATEKEASLVTKVEILDRFSLSTSEIAIICGCKEQSVKDARQKRKKVAKKTKKVGAATEAQGLIDDHD